MQQAKEILRVGRIAGALLAGISGNTIAQAAPAGDPLHGEQLYEDRCAACHAPDEDRAGPHHRGIVGRRAGTVVGYGYSEALARANFTWTEQSLDRWLADPGALVPGQRMDVNVPDPRDRLDLIAYLKSLTL